MFRNPIQKALKEDKFKLANRGIAEIIVNTYPFPNAATNMISISGFNFHLKSNKGKQLMQV